jgi:hypothetical protein
MANKSKSSEAAKRWIDKAEVDYYTYFLTSWITFNAWFGRRYNHNCERDKIDKIKTDRNDVFHRAINDLLEDTGQDGETFLQHIANLHHSLEQAQIEYKRGKLLLFDQIVTIPNPITTINQTHYTIRYKFEITNNQISASITNSKGEILCDYQAETKQYDTKHFSHHLAKRRITPTQKKFAESFFNSIKPRIKLQILEMRKKPQQTEFYNAPDFKFRRDKDNIGDEGHWVINGLVEVLYQLRNLLVHGELVPDEHAKPVYQHAYLIMSMLIPKLI